MKVTITVESSELLTLESVAACVDKTFRRSRLDRHRPLGLEDSGKLDLASTPVNPQAVVRWEVFRSEGSKCRACKAPVAPPHTLCASCADEKGA